MSRAGLDSSLSTRDQAIGEIRIPGWSRRCALIGFAMPWDRAEQQDGGQVEGASRIVVDCRVPMTTQQSWEKGVLLIGCVSGRGLSESDFRSRMTVPRGPGTSTALPHSFSSRFPVDKAISHRRYVIGMFHNRDDRLWCQPVFWIGVDRSAQCPCGLTVLRERLGGLSPPSPTAKHKQKAVVQTRGMWGLIGLNRPCAFCSETCPPEHRDGGHEHVSDVVLAVRPRVPSQGARGEAGSTISERQATGPMAVCSSPV